MGQCVVSLFFLMLFLMVFESYIISERMIIYSI